MTTELKQAAQDAAEAIDWLLKNIRLDAPQLSGKAMGNAEKCASSLRAALAKQPATGEPVARVDYSERGNIAWLFGPQLPDGTELFKRPAPSVPDDVVRDAERYRWLRDNWFTMGASYPEDTVKFHLGNARWSEQPESNLDAAIDAAKDAT